MTTEDTTSNPIDSTPLLRTVTIELPTAVAQKLSEWHEGTLEDAALTAVKLYHGMGREAYAALIELAQLNNTTQAKALRSAITHATTATQQATPGTPGRPKINGQRDAAIFKAINAGGTYARVADDFGLSLVRVGQIVATQRAIRGDAPKRRPAHTPTPTSIPTPTSTPAPQDADRPTPVPFMAPTPQPEVLTLKDSAPTTPSRLAVIPPSMRNPELAPKVIKPVDLDALDNSIFNDDYPI